jgi:hypothetical protein
MTKTIQTLESSVVEQFQQDWQSLQQALGIEGLNIGWAVPELFPVKLQHLKSHTSTQLSLSDIDGIEDWKSVEGWILASDRLYVLPQQVEVFQQQLDQVQVLQMEVTQGHQHWQLIYRGEPGWLLNRFHCEACDSHEATHMAEQVQHLAEKNKGLVDTARLNYLKLWQINELPQVISEGLDTSTPTMPMPELALFNGFDMPSTNRKDKE